MASGFGFTKQPQTPAPRAAAVGLQLRQQQVGGGAGAPPGAGGIPMTPAAPGEADVERQKMMLRAGGEKMGGAGQRVSVGENEPGAEMAAAVGEALTRLGGGYRTNPNPFKPRDKAFQNLQQLGLSEFEAMLLMQTGGL